MANLKIASDHAGFERKLQVMEQLKGWGHQVEDLGSYDDTRVDYPDYADKLCQTLPTKDKDTYGILVCGSGQGMAMRANRYPKIRAALCWNEETAELAREHNNANVICLPSRLISEKETYPILKKFLTTPFEGGRHEKRVDKLNKPVSGESSCS